MQIKDQKTNEEETRKPLSVMCKEHPMKEAKNISLNSKLIDSTGYK